jgi:glycosyltransferase involved in cell wall biosynthesis
VISTNRRLSRHPQAIAFNSQRAHDDHVAMGFRPRAAILINNGIDLQRFVPSVQLREKMRAALGLPLDAKVAIVVARHDPQKDWATILSAVGKVEGLTTIAVGSGTDQLPDQPGLVRFGTHLAMEDVYPAADAFLLPSAFGEGISVAMCEAMACGVPVLVTDVGDNARFAQACGLVVPPRDPEALARNLQDLLTNHARLHALGKAARQVALEHFGPETSFRNLFMTWDAMALTASPAT